VTQVFLYGTLRHMGLLQIVLGHVPEERLTAARLTGHYVARAEGRDFPLIVEREGSEAEGLLLIDVTAEEKTRLDYYELGFGYELRTVNVSGSEALVYFPHDGLWQPAEPWSLEYWSEHHWPITQHSAHELMGLLGEVPARDLPLYFDRITARAYARHLAEIEPSPSTLRSAQGRSEIKLHELKRSHLGYFRTDTLTLEHPRFDGAMSDCISREVFLTGDAAIVLPYDPRRDRILLIEQFRMGPYGRGDLRPWTLEPVAGRVDVGETPLQAAKRECVEEAGLNLSKLLPVANYYPSPGEVSTFFYTFVGLCDLPDKAAGFGGLDSEAEDIRSHVISFDQAEALMKSSEINVGPLLHLLLWLKSERSGLKQE
jgi:ADP-ribose diphosphatase